MNHQRQSHLLIEFSKLPWWASVVVAGAVFASLRWLVPSLFGSTSPLNPLAARLADFALWAAIVFLLPIPFSLYNAHRRRRLIEVPIGIESIRNLSWQEFEELVSEHYQRKGYQVVDRGGAQADGGIDLELRTKDKTVVVQCKHWRGMSVGVKAVRELYGVMVGEQANAAILVTSGRYTPDAIDFARGKPIKLVDGSELMWMLRVCRRTLSGP